MKIEKLNDSQIRCTLNKDDLADRELRISELAYGTEKAKALFRDMMQQASYEFGFDAEDIPLMIEAIPVSTECLILVITKVDDPDELDTRFSKFTQNMEDDSDYYSDELEDDSYADEIISSFDQMDDLSIESSENNFIPLPEALSSKKEKSNDNVPVNSSKETMKSNMVKVYSFQSLEEIIRLSNILVTSYNGENSVFKNAKMNTYYLAIHKSDHTPEEFNKICNIISEYGKQERITYASIAFFKEHFETIVKDQAIQILSTI